MITGRCSMSLSNSAFASCYIACCAAYLIQINKKSCSTCSYCMEVLLHDTI